MRDNPSLAGRATLAIALLFGFYLLAIGIAAFLVWIPWAEWTAAHRIHPKLALVCLAGAAIILWSVIPRPEKFEPPGPELMRSQHPKLFGLIDEMAQATGQPGPVNVYLVPGVNAWVSSRGGWMGAGSQRIMGVGLPLLQVLDVSQFRAVIAHEFGHYHGGDVAVGPWVYATRQAIGRTLQGLSHHSGLLQKPFEWYGGMFLNVTHSISRAQEYAADALAARIVGAGPLVSGLRRIAGSSAAYQPYWSDEVNPVVSAGYRPPLTEGFRQFLEVETIAKSLNDWVSKEEREGTVHPHDTHPSLRDRIEAVAGLPERVMHEEPASALSLIEDPVSVERVLLDAMLVAEHARKIQDIGWDEVGSRVLLPRFDQAASENHEVFRGLTAGDLGHALAPPGELIRKLAERLNASPEAARSHALWIAGAVLTSALASRGLRVRSLPGEPVQIENFDGTLLPTFTIMVEIAEGKREADEWRSTAERLGFAALPLVAEPLPETGIFPAPRS